MTKKRRILIGFIAVILIFFAVIYFNDPSNDLYILDKTLYHQVGSQEHYTQLEDVSPCFLELVVLSEDKRFYKHFGFDIIRTAGVAIDNIKSGQLQAGGSTITQQLAKNLFYSREQTLTRKIFELGTAFRIETYFNKNQILEMYINVIYYGSDAWGIEQAAKVYFDKSAKDLTIEESAVLVGLLPAPSLYNPKENPEIAQQRAEKVLALYRRVHKKNNE